MQVASIVRAAEHPLNPGAATHGYVGRLWKGDGKRTEKVASFFSKTTEGGGGEGRTGRGRGAGWRVLLQTGFLLSFVG